MASTNSSVSVSLRRTETPTGSSSTGLPEDEEGTEAQSKRMRTTTDTEEEAAVAEVNNGRVMEAMEVQHGNPEEEAELRARIMANPLVLDAIAKKLPAKEILTLRQTCTSWNHTFIPELRKKHRPIVLQYKVDLDIDTFPFRAAEYDSKIEDLNYFMQTSMEIPFGRHELRNCTANEWGTCEFFHLCGNSVNSLSIVCDSNVNLRELNIDNIRRAAIQFLPHLEEFKLKVGPQAHIKPFMSGGAYYEFDELPNLKRLVLDIASDNKENETVYHWLVTDLICAAINLEAINCQTRTESGRALDLEVITCLQDHATDPTEHLHRLKVLKLGHWLSVDELTMLIEMANLKENSLSLTTFATRQDSHDQEEERNRLLCNFLITQASTLQTLELDVPGREWRRPNEPFTPLRINTAMDRVHTFYLRTSGIDQVCLRFWGETMISSFPALDKFVVSDTCDQLTAGDWGEEMNRMAHSGVRELSLDMNLEKLNAIECTLFNSIGFPSLTRLEITLTSGTAEEFSVLWTVWPALQYLKFKISEPWLNFDEFLSGVPESSFSDLKTQVDNIHPHLSVDKLQEMSNQFKRKAGISDLKYLRCFIVEMCRGCTLQMTDIGGYFGLLMASPNLQLIEIKKTSNQVDDFNVSTDCRILLRELLGPFAVISL